MYFEYALAAVLIAFVSLFGAQSIARIVMRVYFEEKMRYHKELMSLHAAGTTKGDYQHGQQG